MAIEIGPLQIAAIGFASIAVILVITVIIYHFIRRKKPNARTSSSSSHHSPTSSTAPLSPSQRHSHVIRGTISTFGGLGSTTNVLAHAQTPSTVETALVRPSTGRGYTSSKLRKMMIGVGGGSGGKQLSPGGAKNQSAKLVVITYEDGLRKLGIDPSSAQPRPHHILYPEYDDETGGTRSSGSGGDGPIVGTTVDSPRTNPGRDRGKRPPPALESTWLPSYYHAPRIVHDGGRT
ncbi:hypothetical protein IAR50_001993 [Cryptococcus sp. DSM 104548]